jgi:hypothetical protein
MVWRPLGLLVSVVVAGALVPGATVAASASVGVGGPLALREVLLVGNNWEGTADVVASTADLTRVGRVDVIPDREARLREIYSDPIKLGYFLGIRETVG